MILKSVARGVQAHTLRRLSTGASRSQVIKTAGCIIIGDEVLNSKIRDSNAHYFAQYCYAKGIELKRILVIGDDEADIISSVLEFGKQFDFVVTSGGIGPTHDDITYSSIAKAYGLDLKLHTPTVELYNTLKEKTSSPKLTTDQEAARRRMFELPFSSDFKTPIAHYYIPGKWVPIVNINNKLNILPGVPPLFEELLDKGITPNIKHRLPTTQYLTKYVVTDFLESQLAPVISKEQEKIKSLALPIKIGSYPHWEKGVTTISISGTINNLKYMQSLVNYLKTELKGKELSKDEEKKLSEDRTISKYKI